MRHPTLTTIHLRPQSSLAPSMSGFFICYSCPIHAHCSGVRCASRANLTAPRIKLPASGVVCLVDILYRSGQTSPINLTSRAPVALDFHLPWAADEVARTPSSPIRSGLSRSVQPSVTATTRYHHHLSQSQRHAQLQVGPLAMVRSWPVAPCLPIPMQAMASCLAIIYREPS